MDLFSDVSDRSESSTLSDSGTGTIRTTSYSDEEVILASDRPKRRAGRRIFKETRHPVYRGVRKRNNNKWVCELREPNKKSRIWLGTYPTAEMAARAHDVASLALRGKSACLNFADSAWRFPIPASSDRNVIRKAAAQAANECNNEGEDEVVERVEPRERIYVEEEDGDLSDMPMLLADLAAGLLLSPPPFYVSDDVEWGDVSLWSF